MHHYKQSVEWILASLPVKDGGLGIRIYKYDLSNGVISKGIEFEWLLTRFQGHGTL